MLDRRYEDLAPQAASTIPWITFGGLPTESSSAFVRGVQRIGFQQGRGRDDGWMAEYAATCFEGDALTWYAELDDEVQESWKKLRAILLRKYPHVVGVRTPLLFSAPQPAIAPSVPVSVCTSSASTSPPQGPVGRIEVLSSHTVLLGYLSFDPTSGIDITTDSDRAAIISFPLSKGTDVLHLDMLNVPSRVLPYLGLALLVPQGKDQNVVPDMLPGVTSSYSCSATHYSGVPEPSSNCKHSMPASSRYESYTKADFATWQFCACGESEKVALYRRRSPTQLSGTRAAAAVWKYNKNTEELTIYWLMDDDTECEVGGYVRNGTSDQLHVHRVSDMDKTEDYILEERVRFVFRLTQ